ncbi:CBS domain-containing protein [Sedimenticola thiotaurini]|uniref:CBS domain-containing protein n=1 Tax=Sedimenticola thiotaurini TaxID=1543721 RepID=A0A0F7K549_9GAMM|nr:CBS domain-containing protein [Sedimenticola thiotaurini]AKH22078.1 hypothetical protein AAY24_05805 [Sedimenticola thiotaurini]
MSKALPHVRVRDIMDTGFGLIEGSATVYQALLMMKELGASFLVVNRRHEDDEYGLVLVSDIARQVLAVDRPPKRVNVYEVMTKPAVYVDPEMDIRYCSRLFARFDLIRALVVEKGQMLGVISPKLLVLDGIFLGLDQQR